VNLLEKAILMAFPGWAARRAASRYIARQFTGADLDRLRGRRSYTSQGPVTENTAARPTLLHVARDLDRNNSFAHGAFNSLIDNVVGRGISLEARVAFRTGRLREKVNREIEAAWTEWSKKADLHRIHSYAELQRLCDRELWVAGEVLIIRTESRGAGIPLALEIADSERLAALDSDEKNGNEIVQGVEYTATGAIVAYHVYPRHPSDSRAVTQAERIPAERVIHLYRLTRPNQVRGISRVASVARNFEALGQYMDHEMTRARIAASFAMMIKRGGLGLAPKFPSPGASADTTDANDNTLAHLEGGMIFTGGPNDSIEGTGPATTTTAFEQFVTVNLRAIAVGLNMSYELLARDYTKTNFSSARQSDLQDRRHWSPRQQYLNDHLNDRIFQWFVDSAIVAGVQPFPQFYGFTGRYGSTGIDHGWITPPREYVDPTKEQDADERAVASGFTNIAKIAAKHGTDVHENLRINSQIAEEADELGLSLPAVSVAVAAPPPPATPEEPDNDDDQEDAAD
jgi:lambda family phage portal protein